MKNGRMSPGEQQDATRKIRRKQLADTRKLLRLDDAPPWILNSALPQFASAINRYYQAGAGNMQNVPRDPPIEEKPQTVVRSHVSYLSPLFDTPDVCVQTFRVKMRAVDFDTLIGRGLSGTLAAQLFARALGVHFAIVRKDTDHSHSFNTVEGNVGKRWVFVDDLVCSGETRDLVRNAMKTFCERHQFESEYVGDYLFYEGGTFRPKENGNV
jgi:hypothetical protein